MVAEEEAEPAAGTELVVELEATVVPRVATVPVDLDVAAMLRTEGRSPAGQQHRNNSERPHRRPPWGRVAGAPQNRKFSLNVRYLRNPTTRDEAWRTPGRVRRCWVAFPVGTGDAQLSPIAFDRLLALSPSWQWGC